MTNRLTDADLDRLEALCAEATPAPWMAHARHVHNDGNQDEMDGLGWDLDGPPKPLLRGQFAKAADAKLAAESRTALPALVAEVRRLRGEIQREANRRLRRVVDMLESGEVLVEWIDPALIRSFDRLFSQSDALKGRRHE